MHIFEYATPTIQHLLDTIEKTKNYITSRKLYSELDRMSVIFNAIYVACPFSRLIGEHFTISNGQRPAHEVYDVASWLVRRPNCSEIAKRLIKYSLNVTNSVSS